MIPLWRETGYRFDFDEPRKVERIHLQGAFPGDFVGLYRRPYSPGSSAVVSGIVGEEGWALLENALFTVPGDRFVALVNPHLKPQPGLLAPASDALIPRENS